MTKAEKFNRDIQDVLQKRIEIEEALSVIKNARPIHQDLYLGLLSVSNDGNMNINKEGNVCFLNPEDALVLAKQITETAKWIMETFGG